MSKIVPMRYEGHALHFTDDGWFNATEASAKFGRNPNDWVRLPATQSYLAAFVRKYGNISYLKTRRGVTGGTWLHPKLAVRFAQWLDDDFAVWCDMQIDALIRGRSNPADWRRLRHEAAASFKVMNQIVQLTREARGKTCAPHHFINEARLVNWATSGEFRALDRDRLSTPDLDVLAKLEERNAVLISIGQSYEERKAALERLAAQQRATPIIGRTQR